MCRLCNVRTIRPGPRVCTRLPCDFSGSVGVTARRRFERPVGGITNRRIAISIVAKAASDLRSRRPPDESVCRRRRPPTCERLDSSCAQFCDHPWWDVVRICSTPGSTEGIRLLRDCHSVIEGGRRCPSRCCNYEPGGRRFESCRARHFDSTWRGGPHPTRSPGPSPTHRRTKPRPIKTIYRTDSITRWNLSFSRQISSIRSVSTTMR